MVDDTGVTTSAEVQEGTLLHFWPGAPGASAGKHQEQLRAHEPLQDFPPEGEELRVQPGRPQARGHPAGLPACQLPATTSTSSEDTTAEEAALTAGGKATVPVRRQWLALTLQGSFGRKHTEETRNAASG